MARHGGSTVMEDARWVARLDPRLTTPLEPALPDLLIRRAASIVGREPAAWTTMRSREFAPQLLRDVPEIGDTDRSLQAIRIGVESACLHTLVLLSGGGPAAGGEVDDVRDADREDVLRLCVDEAGTVLRRWVQHRLPLDRLWATIRGTHSWVTTTFAEACVGLVPPAEQANELRTIFAATTRYFDQLVETAGDEFESVVARASSRGVNRQQLVHSILRGERLGIDLETLSRSLDYRLDDRRHLGLVVRSSDASVDVASVITAWLRSRGAEQALLLQRSKRSYWAWGATSGTPPRSVVIDSPPLPSEVRIVYGDWRWGIDGFRTTHHEARAAEDVVVQCHGVAGGTVDHRRWTFSACWWATPVVPPTSRGASWVL
jgi:hypothetical protein